MVIFFSFQLGGLFSPGGSDTDNPLMYILWFAPIIILMIVYVWFIIKKNKQNQVEAADIRI